MRLNRFYVSKVHDKWGPLKLDHQVWLNDKVLTNQILKVLRLKIGEQIILFDDEVERIYEIDKIEFPGSVHLKLITDITRKKPGRHLYLMWSMLKKDKNDWVIQKGTELGIKNFVPLISDRSEKQNLDLNRAQKIIIEACEQCGRADIPEIREPISLTKALEEYREIPLFVCELGGSNDFKDFPDKCGVLIGPEGGWSETEMAIFQKEKQYFLHISDFILRAETAAVAAASMMLIDNK